MYQKVYDINLHLFFFSPSSIPKILDLEISFSNLAKVKVHAGKCSTAVESWTHTHLLMLILPSVSQNLPNILFKEVFDYCIHI